MIYFPVTCDILTPGHIECFKWLLEKDTLMVGVLTDRALKGYKKNLVPFKDRFYIVEHIGIGMGFITVPQDSLNPEGNIRQFKIKGGLASGDGFEVGELETIKRFKLEKINIRLSGEKKKRWSSSAIIKKAKQ